MKVVSYALAILFATCAPTSAQTGPTGTWRAEGPAFPWEVVLRVDGPRLTGLVGQCAPRIAEISDGRIEGNTITFTCKRIDNIGTVVLTGRINGDEIAFTWKLHLGKGGALPPAANQMFGPSTPPRFTAKRVPDGDLARLADQVGGVEFSATVNLLPKNMRVIGTLFLPHRVSRVRAVIVVVRWGNGSLFYPDQEVRRLAETTDSVLLLTDFATIRTPIDQIPRGPDGADGLLMLLRRLAQESGHQELTDAPLLFWGHSAGGGGVFAEALPQRTIAFVAYRTPGGGANLKVLGQIPALFLVGGKDTTVLRAPIENRWTSGRSLGAPWTFSLDPDADHGSEESLRKANALVIPWIASVLRQRLSPAGGPLRVVTDGSAWLGNNMTGEAAPHGAFPGSKLDASWLPDEPSARGWRAVLGAAK